MDRVGCRRKMAPPTTTIRNGAPLPRPGWSPNGARGSGAGRSTTLETQEALREGGPSRTRDRTGSQTRWVKRVLGLGEKRPLEWSARGELADLKRDLLVKMDRGSEALSAAWADSCKSPSEYSYDDLMKFVPKPERGAWHEKAIEGAQTAGLHSRMELLFETKEFGRLAGLVRGTENPALENLSHYTTEPVAKRLERPHPDLAGRLWRGHKECESATMRICCRCSNGNGFRPS